MATEFTEKEGQLLGQLFPNGLLTKVGVVIRDAILAAPQLAQKIREIIAEEIQKLSLRIEHISNELPKQVQTEVTYQLANNSKTAQIDEEALYQKFVSRLLTDQSFQRNFAEVQRTSRQRAEESRRETITQIIAGIRHIPIMAVNQDLVDDLDGGMVIKNMKTDQTRLKAVEDALVKRQDEMVEAIKSLVLKNKQESSAELISKYAQVLVDQAIPSDKPTEVRSALQNIDEENEIAPILKK